MQRSPKVLDARREGIVSTLHAGLTTADAIADRFGVSVRTVYRDITLLRAAGQPIRGEASMGYVLRNREARHADR